MVWLGNLATGKKNLSACIQKHASLCTRFSIFRFQQVMLDLACCKDALPRLDLGKYSVVEILKGVPTTGVVARLSVFHERSDDGGLERAVRYRVWDLDSLRW